VSVYPSAHMCMCASAWMFMHKCVCVGGGGVVHSVCAGVCVCVCVCSGRDVSCARPADSMFMLCNCVQTCKLGQGAAYLQPQPRQPKYVKVRPVCVCVWGGGEEHD